MGAHIDVFVNDWGNAVQRLVARVSLVDGTVNVLTFGDPSYDELVRRPITLESGEEVYDFKTPDDFFHALPGSFTGSYISATPIHEEHECPFEENVVPFQSQDLKLALPN